MQRTRYQCSMCPSSYSQKAKLNFHVKLIHESTKDATCGYCEKSFATVSSKKRHEIIVHMGAKPYQCMTNGCSAAFSSLCLLRGHIRKEHDKKLKCPECKREFTYKHTLDEHAKRCGARCLPSFQCDKCSSVFTTKRALQAHVKGQHDNIHCVCEICGQSFTYRSSYKRHQRRKHDKQ